MEQAIAYWLLSTIGQVLSDGRLYQKKKKETNEAIGTIELFTETLRTFLRTASCLRLDIRSEYERAGEITKILKMIIEPAYTLLSLQSKLLQKP